MAKQQTQFALAKGINWLGSLKSLGVGLPSGGWFWGSNEFFRLGFAQVLSSAFCCVALVSGFKKRQDGLPEVVSSPLNVKSRGKMLSPLQSLLQKC